MRSHESRRPYTRREPESQSRLRRFGIIPSTTLQPCNIPSDSSTLAMLRGRTVLVRLAILGLTILTALCVGCSALPGHGASAESGKLTVLGSAEEVYVLGMTNAFEADTGIKTSYLRLSTGEALGRLRADKNHQQFSVWWGGPIDSYVDASGEALLEQYRPRGSSTLPRQYKDDG